MCIRDSVVLDHLGALGREHEAAVQAATIVDALTLRGGDGLLEDAAHLGMLLELSLIHISPT